MASEYIASRSNRIYFKSEITDSEINNMEGAQIAPVTKFDVKANRKLLFRRDKTGYRSEVPILGPQRELIEFSLECYGTGWSGGGSKPSLAPLLESGFCRSSELKSSLVVSSSTGNSVTLQSDADLVVGSAVAFGSEIRFVEAVLGSRDFSLNAPFTVELGLGAELMGCANLSLGDEVLPLSILDAWSPQQAVQRFLAGAVADQLRILINNDFLEIAARGFARRLIDSVSGPVDVAFPSEPAGGSPLMNSPIGGHLGQAFLGLPGGRLCTLTSAEVRIDNDIEPRTDEFGCFETKAFILGGRRVSLDLTVFERSDDLSQAMYRSAVNNEPFSVMLQVGNQPGSMFAVYLPAVLFPVPQFNEGKSRLLWQFQGATAMGAQNDEIYVAMR